MDRQMAPTSQGFDQGGIFSRDWFSDRLDSTRKAGACYFYCLHFQLSLYSMKQLHLYPGSKALKKLCVAVPYLYILITQE